MANEEPTSWLNKPTKAMTDSATRKLPARPQPGRRLPRSPRTATCFEGPDQQTRETESGHVQRKTPETQNLKRGKGLKGTNIKERIMSTATDSPVPPPPKTQGPGGDPSPLGGPRCGQDPQRNRARVTWHRNDKGTRDKQLVRLELPSGHECHERLGTWGDVPAPASPQGRDGAQGALVAGLCRGGSRPPSQAPHAVHPGTRLQRLREGFVCTHQIGGSVHAEHRLVRCPTPFAPAHPSPKAGKRGRRAR